MPCSPVPYVVVAGVEARAVVLDLEDEPPVPLGEPHDARAFACAYFATFCIASSAQK